MVDVGGKSVPASPPPPESVPASPAGDPESPLPPPPSLFGVPESVLPAPPSPAGPLESGLLPPLSPTGVLESVGRVPSVPMPPSPLIAEPPLLLPHPATKRSVAVARARDGRAVLGLMGQGDSSRGEGSTRAPLVHGQS